MPVPDLLGLIPAHSPVRRVVEYCVNDLGLSLTEADRVLADANGVTCALLMLLNGRFLSAAPIESPGERAEYP